MNRFLIFICLIASPIATIQAQPKADVGSRCEFSNGSFELSEGLLLKTNPSGDIQWAKQISAGTQHITASSTSAVYGISGQKVYKLDGFGNLVWCLNFSVKPVPSNPEPTSLSGIALSGSKLFIQIYQGPYFSLSPCAYNGGVLLLDTNGVLLTLKMDYVLNVGPVFHSGCVAGYDGGAWLLFNRRKSMGSCGNIQYVDSAGNLLSNHSRTIDNYAYTDIISFKHTTDSSFLLAANTYGSQTQNLAHFSIGKLDKYGNEVWAYAYYDPYYASLPYYSGLAKSLAMDGQNTIYVMTDLLRPDNSGLMDGPMGVIIESNGMVRLNNYWENPPQGLWNYLHMGFDNGQLIGTGTDASGQGTVVYFDSTFNNTCMGPSSTFLLDFAFQGIIPSTGVYSMLSPINYTPAQDTVNITTINPINYQELCSIINSSAPLSLNTSIIQCFPNPATDELLVSSTQSIHPESIGIVDLTGRSVTPEISYTRPDRMKIDVRTFQAGYYLLQCTTMDGKTSMTRFIKR